jgi:P27 family predicted phage terminase small subunit
VPEAQHALNATQGKDTEMNTKSEEQKKLQGTFQKRPSRGRKVTVEAGAPEPPKWLSKVARGEWKRILPLLLERGSLTAADATALGTYCATVARYIAASESLESDGMQVETVITDNNGVIHTKKILNPMLKVAESSERAMFRFLKELGITPASREKIKPAKKSEKGKTLLEQLAERGIV